MAMCTTGSLSIKATAGTCRDICAAVVAGGGTPSGSLVSLSTSAGKSAPHGMLEFYGYNPVSTISVNMSVQFAFPPTSGWGIGGCVILRCSGGVAYCTRSFPAFTNQDDWIWSPPAGTYCVDFGNVTIYCSYAAVEGSLWWDTDTSSGSYHLTNTFNTNEQVDGTFYPY